MLTLIQALWVALLAVWAAFLIWAGNPIGFALAAIAVVYGYVTLELRRRARWAWWASWIPPIAALVLVAPRDIYNYFLFFSNDPRYVDSPATILVVAVSTLVFVVPAVAVAILLLAERRSSAPDKSLERTRER